jgi:hypothetical protein
MNGQGPWYHRPEWIGLIVTLTIGAAAAVLAYGNGQAQITQNTKDISELKQIVGAMPERLARIETKVDDLKAMESRHQRGGSE